MQSDDTKNAPNYDLPKIGRVVTSYGHWDMIARWIYDERLLQPHVTWLFVNDKPSDPLPERHRKQISRFGPVIEPPVNMGRCCARNLGINNIMAEWIDVVDGDDLPYPIDSDFDRDIGDVGQVYFEVVHHRETDGVIVPEKDEGWLPPPENQLMKALVGNWDPRPIAVLWKRDVVNALGGFDGRADYVEDLNLAIRARLGKVPYAHVNIVKGSYQRGTVGRSSPPIVSVANLWNWEIARPLATGDTIALLEGHIRDYRKSLLWTGMRELEKSEISLWEKLYETGKWILGKHKPKS